MSIQYTTNTEGDTLFVRTSGFDENLEEIEAYAEAIIGECLKSGANRVLCDETALEYRLNTVDTLFAGKHLASRAPRNLTIAIACNPKFQDDARFFENVVVNRGMILRMFLDIESARSWLMEKGGTTP